MLQNLLNQIWTYYGCDDLHFACAHLASFDVCVDMENPLEVLLNRDVSISNPRNSYLVGRVHNAGPILQMWLLVKKPLKVSSRSYFFKLKKDLISQVWFIGSWSGNSIEPKRLVDTRLMRI